MPFYMKDADAEAEPGVLNRGAVRRQGGWNGCDQTLLVGKRVVDGDDAFCVYG
jgi:hypothetical protein